MKTLTVPLDTTYADLRFLHEDKEIQLVIRVKPRNREVPFDTLPSTGVGAYAAGQTTAVPSEEDAEAIEFSSSSRAAQATKRQSTAVPSTENAPAAESRSCSHAAQAKNRLATAAVAPFSLPAPATTVPSNEAAVSPTPVRLANERTEPACRATAEGTHAAVAVTHSQRTKPTSQAPQAPQHPLRRPDNQPKCGTRERPPYPPKRMHRPPSPVLTVTPPRPGID